MWQWMKAFLVSLVLFSTAPAFCQTDDDIAAQFARDAAQHTRDLRDLYAMRGIQAPAKLDDPTLADVQQYLVSQRIDRSAGYAPGSAVLFYAHVDGQLAAYLIGQQGLIASSRTTVTQAELDAATQRYRETLAVDGIDRARAPVWRGSDPAAATPRVTPPAAAQSQRVNQRALDAILLPPAIREGLMQVRHLIVISKGAIATNPFSALRLNGDELLVDRMSVTVSAGLFDVDQMISPWNGQSAFRRALVVGDPLVPPSPNWSVPRLPGAAQEAELVASRSQVTPLIGDQATKADVMQQIDSAQVLYFAAHGISNPLEPLTGGFLMLSGPTEAEAFLTAGEVQRRRLNAKLAVLSACQSGLGFNHDGGVIGLARSFQKAGVPRVVMSLWSVSDTATLFLMDRFYIHAMEQMPAEALRLAMLDARREFDDPALWAPFALFGTPR